MFNQSYINDFATNNPNNPYKIYLENPNYLRRLKEEYKQKYGEEANAFFLAFKESLDHYVAKQISENKSYINSEEFKNYRDYIKEIVSETYIQYGKNKIFMELNTNIIFEYLSKEDLQKVFGKNSIKSIIEKNNYGIKSIMNKVSNNEHISDGEIKILSTYFDSKKDFRNPEFMQEYSKFIQYIMNNRQSLRTSPELLSAILTFLPAFYKEGTEDVRSFVAKFDDKYSNKKINYAHSSGTYKYTAFELERFKEIQLSSDKSLNSSRTYKELDLMFLLYVQLHELSHQVQKNKASESVFNLDAIPYEIKNLLNTVYGDYNRSKDKNFEGNHDSDEIEIDADQKGWTKLSNFISKFMEKNEKNRSLSRLCTKNARAVNCRRAFSIKSHPITKERYRAMDYDMYWIGQAIKNNPELLKNYPHLEHIFTSQGQIKISVLLEDEITMSPAGRTICNYILNNAPEHLMINKINSNTYSNKQIKNFFENLVHVSHANALYLRELKQIDLKTYEETHAQYKIQGNLDNVYNTYFVECANQLLKFSNLIEQSRTRLGNDYVDSCYKFFMDYYNEMLENINIPDYKKIETAIKKLEESSNLYLKRAAKQTMEYIRNKQGVVINPDYISTLSKKAIQNHPDTFCQGVADINGIVSGLSKNPVIARG